MELLKRLSASLFAPKDVIPYRYDRWYVTAFYFIILLLISILPISIIALKQDLITYEVKQQVKDIFAGEEIPFTIVDGILVQKDDDSGFVYKKAIASGINVVATTGEFEEANNSLSTINIVFKTEGVYVIQSLLEYQILDYDDYPAIANLDLSNASEVNNITFWNDVFAVAEQSIATYNPYIKSFTITIALIETIINLLFISLLLSVVQFFSMSHTIRFHEMWKICIYLLTPYVIGSSLFIMFSNVLLYYAGFFITATYVFIVGRQVLKDVMRRDNHEL